MRIGSIAGLVELLEDRQGDLYRLGQELQLEVDDILPIVEATQVMRLVSIKEGDITLTEVGKQFIGSGIDERKAIFRNQL